MTPCDDNAEPKNLPLGIGRHTMMYPPGAAVVKIVFPVFVTSCKVEGIPDTFYYQEAFDGSVWMMTMHAQYDFNMRDADVKINDREFP